MKTRRTFPAIALLLATALCAANNSWNKISYIGGTVPAKTNPYDWNTTLTVTPGEITLVIAYGKPLKIPVQQVTALSYGQEAHRRVAEMVALSVMVVNPAALFGILHKSKEHFIGIEFQGENGKPESVLLQAHKDNYKAILEALSAATGKPVKNAP